jgi:hypothetical protein
LGGRVASVIKATEATRPSLGFHGSQKSDFGAPLLRS